MPCPLMRRLAHSAASWPGTAAERRQDLGGRQRGDHVAESGGQAVERSGRQRGQPRPDVGRELRRDHQQPFRQPGQQVLAGADRPVGGFRPGAGAVPRLEAHPDGGLARARDVEPADAGRRRRAEAELAGPVGSAAAGEVQRVVAAPVVGDREQPEEQARLGHRGLVRAENPPRHGEPGAGGGVRVRQQEYLTAGALGAERDRPPDRQETVRSVVVRLVRAFWSRRSRPGARRDERGRRERTRPRPAARQRAAGIIGPVPADRYRPSRGPAEPVQLVPPPAAGPGRPGSCRTAAARSKSAMMSAAVAASSADTAVRASATAAIRAVPLGPPGQDGSGAGSIGPRISASASTRR